MLDTRGFLTEGTGSNLFLVREGKLLTPKAAYVLAGVTRAVVIELGARLGIAWEETDLALYDAATADEAFISSTSLCICPVASINGQAMANESVPGPVTQRLIDAFAEEVGLDYVGQYLSHLP